MSLDQNKEEIVTDDRCCDAEEKKIRDIEGRMSTIYMVFAPLSSIIIIIPECVCTYMVSIEGGWIRLDSTRLRWTRQR